MYYHKQTKQLIIFKKTHYYHYRFPYTLGCFTQLWILISRNWYEISSFDTNRRFLIGTYLVRNFIQFLISLRQVYCGQWMNRWPCSIFSALISPLIPAIRTALPYFTCTEILTSKFTVRLISEKCVMTLTTIE